MPKGSGTPVSTRLKPGGPVGARAFGSLAMAAVIAAAGIGVVVHRATATPTILVDGSSGLREVPASQTLEPGAALLTTSPEPTTTTTVPETTTSTASTTSTTKPARRAADLGPIVAGSIDARVSAFGDSVMLEAAPELAVAVTNLSVDAVIGRQAGGTLDAVRAFHDSDRLGDEIVVQVGNNGTVTSDEFDEIMSLLAGAQRVVVLNVKVDRDWEGPNNDLLAARVSRWKNAVLLDWYSLASADPEGLLSDGVHLQPAGVQLYTRLILSAL